MIYLFVEGGFSFKLRGELFFVGGDFLNLYKFFFVEGICLS